MPTPAYRHTAKASPSTQPLPLYPPHPVQRIATSQRP